MILGNTPFYLLLPLLSLSGVNVTVASGDAGDFIVGIGVKEGGIGVVVNSRNAVGVVPADGGVNGSSVATSEGDAIIVGVSDIAGVYVNVDGILV